MNIKEESLIKHYEWKGKIEISPRVSADSKEALSLCYTPGVAEACLKIKEDEAESYELTRRWNTVPVITDGTAVLGLGDIGPVAGLPVMEGKAALFKTFGGVDAYPLCIRSKSVDEIVNTVKLLAGSWGGVNLEDISAPRCFEIEKRLIEELDIPVFHDDQHGTAIVVAAALRNALKLAKKDISKIKVVVNGAGAAGTAISRFLLKSGVKNLTVCDKNGILSEAGDFTTAQKELAKITNPEKITGGLKEALAGADVFIGVSAANCVTKDMVRSMAKNPIVFAMANPVPEISREDALDAGAFIVGTGSSEKPNQINNVLVFPGLFRGALDARAKKITDEMMQAASKAIAASVPDKLLNRDFILPYAFDKDAHREVAKAVFFASRSFAKRMNNE